jgi:hypothetical protein
MKAYVTMASAAALSVGLVAGTPATADPFSFSTGIRNENLVPDWSRIGTDITHQGPFNAAFSLAGDTIPGAGTPGKPNCHGQTISAMAHEFGGIHQAALSLGFFRVDALQDAVSVFCQL